MFGVVEVVDFRNNCVANGREAVENSWKLKICDLSHSKPIGRCNLEHKTH